MANRERPLSPFMLGQTYRFQLTSLLSILFRIAGIGITVGAFVFAWWLLAQGGDAYERAAACLASPVGMVALFLFSLGMVYHLLAGIRHLLWDAGWGFELPEVYRSGYAVVGLTLVLTSAIWFVALRGGA